MDWKSVIGKVAPTVAAALGGPLAGEAVTVVGELLGITEPTSKKIQAAIEAGQLTGEQVSKLRELEMQYQNEEKERDFRYSDLEFKDRESARQREIHTGDSVNRNLAYFIVSAFIAITACTLIGWTKVDSVLAGTLIGYLSAKCEQVLSYYFGSSKSSAQKTELLAKANSIS